MWTFLVYLQTLLYLLFSSLANANGRSPTSREMLIPSHPDNKVCSVHLYFIKSLNLQQAFQVLINANKPNVFFTLTMTNSFNRSTNLTEPWYYFHEQCTLNIIFYDTNVLGHIPLRNFIVRSSYRWRSHGLSSFITIVPSIRKAFRMDSAHNTQLKLFIHSLEGSNMIPTYAYFPGNVFLFYVIRPRLDRSLLLYTGFVPLEIEMSQPRITIITTTSLYWSFPKCLTYRPLKSNYRKSCVSTEFIVHNLRHIHNVSIKRKIPEQFQPEVGLVSLLEIKVPWGYTNFYHACAQAVADVFFCLTDYKLVKTISFSNLHQPLEQDVWLDLSIIIEVSSVILLPSVYQCKLKSALKHIVDIYCTCYKMFLDQNPNVNTIRKLIVLYFSIIILGCTYKQYFTLGVMLHQPTIEIIDLKELVRKQFRIFFFRPNRTAYDSNVFAKNRNVTCGYLKYL